jgi:hypothetical protein
MAQLRWRDLPGWMLAERQLYRALRAALQHSGQEQSLALLRPVKSAPRAMRDWRNRSSLRKGKRRISAQGFCKRKPSSKRIYHPRPLQIWLTGKD